MLDDLLWVLEQPLRRWLEKRCLRRYREKAVQFQVVDAFDSGVDTMRKTRGADEFIELSEARALFMKITAHIGVEPPTVPVRGRGFLLPVPSDGFAFRSESDDGTVLLAGRVARGKSKVLDEILHRQFTDRDRINAEAFFGHLLDGVKSGEIKRDVALGALKNIMNAIDDDNYFVARQWIEEGRKFVQGSES